MFSTKYEISDYESEVLIIKRVIFYPRAESLRVQDAGVVL